MKPIHRIAAVGLGLGMSAQVLAGPDGVLLIGDSRAEQQWDDQTHALVFDALGFGQIPDLDGADCFHLSGEGYDGIVKNQFDGYFETCFDVIFRTSFR